MSMSSSAFKELASYNGVDVNQEVLLKILVSVYVALETRFGYLKQGSRINFIEIINNGFPTIESLRSSVLQSNSTSLLGCGYIQDVLKTIIDISVFEDRWNQSYTGWIQNFKSTSNYKELVARPKSHVYEDIQSFFWQSSRLYEDASDLIAQIKGLSRTSAEMIDFIHANPVKKNIYFIGEKYYAI